MALFTGKQYAIGCLLISLMCIVGVLLHHYLVYGFGMSFTTDEISTLGGLPCLVIFVSAALWAAENTYI